MSVFLLIFLLNPLSLKYTEYRIPFALLPSCFHLPILLHLPLSLSPVSCVLHALKRVHVCAPTNTHTPAPYLILIQIQPLIF